MILRPVKVMVRVITMGRGHDISNFYRVHVPLLTVFKNMFSSFGRSILHVK